MKPHWRFAMVAFTEVVIAVITMFLVYELVEGNGKLSEAERFQMFALISGGLYGMIKVLDNLIDKDLTGGKSKDDDHQHKD